MPPRQFRIHIAPEVLAQLRAAIQTAAAHGRRADAVHAALKIEDGLRWLADELGESRYPLKRFGELRVVLIGPIGAVYAVHRGRMEVNVGRLVLMGATRRR